MRIVKRDGLLDTMANPIVEDDPYDPEWIDEADVAIAAAKREDLDKVMDELIPGRAERRKRMEAGEGRKQQRHQRNALRRSGRAMMRTIKESQRDHKDDRPPN